MHIHDTNLRDRIGSLSFFEWIINFVHTLFVFFKSCSYRCIPSKVWYWVRLANTYFTLDTCLLIITNFSGETLIHIIGQFILIRPSFNLFFTNYSLWNALVMISTIWSSVLQNFISIDPLSVLSLKKWWLISICLVLLCCIGFLAMFRALVFSHTIGVVFATIPKSFNYCLIHSN